MSDLLSLVSDVSLIEMAARVALGEAPPFDDLVPCSGTSYLFYVQAPATASRVAAITGLDDLDRLPGVVNVRLNRPAGSAVDWRDGNHGYVFSVLGSTRGEANLLEMARVVHEKVVITYR